MTWAADVWRRTRQIRNAYKILVRKQEGKKPLKTRDRRAENNIKMNVGHQLQGVYWTQIAQDTDR